MLNYEDTLWVLMFKDIYLGENLVLNVTTRKGFPTWNSIVKTIEHLKDRFQFKLGDGNSSFWYSPWLDKEPFCTRVPYVHYHDINWSIKDLVDGNDLKLSRLYSILPTNIINKIISAPHFTVHDVPDVWVWTNCTSAYICSRRLPVVNGSSDFIAWGRKLELDLARLCSFKYSVLLMAIVS